MAERLTKKITKTIQDKYSLGSYLYYDFNGVENTNRLLNKLGKLEDILEKYGIENLEYYLQKMREVDKELRDTIQKLHTIIDTIGYDRDTWQKACELACEHISTVHIITNDDMLENQDNLPPYFYQQAKKEKEE